MSSSLMDFARRLRRVEKTVNRLATQPRLAYSSIEDGSIDEYDADGNLVQIIGQQYDGSHVAASVGGPTPPTPTIPTVAEVPGGLRVSWSGYFADSDGNASSTIVAPMDFKQVDVVVSTAATPDFIATLPSHSILSPRAGEIFLALPQVEHKVALVTRSLSGKPSVPSAYALGTPQSANATSDGLAPATAPTPTVDPGIGSLFVTWDPITNADPVTYEVFISSTTPVVIADANKVASTPATIVTVNALADGTPLSPATTYHVAIRTKDDDGLGPVSPEASGSPEEPFTGPITETDIEDDAITTPKVRAGSIVTAHMTANSISGDRIVAGSIHAAKIQAGTITATEISSGAITSSKLSATAIDGKTITGATFLTGPSGQARIEISDNNYAYGAIEFYTGHPNETQRGLIEGNQTAAGEGRVSIMTPRMSNYPAAQIELVSEPFDGIGNEFIRLVARDIYAEGDLDVTTKITSPRVDIQSTVDAGNTAGAYGALNVGDVGWGQHLRIDTNEIICMATPSSQGTLFLNRGGDTVVADTTGGALRIGGGGSRISTMRAGRTVVNLNGAGEATITHSIGTVPEIVLCQMQNSANTINVYDRQANNFSIRVTNDAGAAVTGSRNIGWMAMNVL